MGSYIVEHLTWDFNWERIHRNLP